MICELYLLVQKHTAGAHWWQQTHHCGWQSPWHWHHSYGPAAARRPGDPAGTMWPTSSSASPSSDTDLRGSHTPNTSQTRSLPKMFWKPSWLFSSYLVWSPAALWLSWRGRSKLPGWRGCCWKAPAAQWLEFLLGGNANSANHHAGWPHTGGEPVTHRNTGRK